MPMVGIFHSEGSYHAARYADYYQREVVIDDALLRFL